ncbi:MAG TPA: hypothetical protein VFZ69_01400 [Longimicrobiales bacterium]
MDPIALMGMVFTLVLTLLIGGFVLLYPIAKRLGALLESRIASEKVDAGPLRAEIRKLAESMSSMEAELRALRERQEFTEQVLSTRERPKLPSEPPV